MTLIDSPAGPKLTWRNPGGGGSIFLLLPLLPHEQPTGVAILATSQCQKWRHKTAKQARKRSANTQFLSPHKEEKKRARSGTNARHVSEIDGTPFMPEHRPNPKQPGHNAKSLESEETCLRLTKSLEIVKVPHPL
jgi:hypothetical protein